ncbi:MAG TPA: hypothetical protein VKU87_01865 [Thermomicrobiaceae bacterium]|nr:hypothetical protein [Thermomicrobiaceae bacterium]
MDQVTILVVSRDVLELAHLNEVLAIAGYYPILSTEHQNARKLAHQERPQAMVIALDSSNPSDNWETFRDLLRDPVTATTPTVLIVTRQRPSWPSSHDFKNEHLVVLQQPIVATELVETIRRVIRRQRVTAPIDRNHAERRRTYGLK